MLMTQDSIVLLLFETALDKNVSLKIYIFYMYLVFLTHINTHFSVDVRKIEFHKVLRKICQANVTLANVFPNFVSYQGFYGFTLTLL